jgi:hypothetical protein
MFISRLILAAVLPAAALFAQPDCLPLQVGNQWVYRSSGGEIMTLEVTRSAEFSGRLYYLLQGLPDGDHWLRRDESSAVYAYDPSGGQEQLWYAFWNPAGEPYHTFLPGSNNTAVVSSTKAVYSGPIGWFDWALEIQYPVTFQVGLYREVFLPYVGLVHREQGAGGPAMLSWDMIYARLGGVTYISEQTAGFGLSLDRAVYPVSSEMVARLTITNTHWEPLQLEFPSSQTFEFVLKNERGDTVYQWSDGRSFLPVMRSEMYGYGEKNYAILVPLAAKTGVPLPAGKYTAEAWLTTSTPQLYRASTGFEITYAN